MRTDVHAPKNLITEDYEFVACGNYGTSTIDAYSPLVHEAKYLIDAGWKFGKNCSAGSCYHCGAHLIYYAILKHLPTKTLIRVGETCLDNRFSLATEEFHKLRKAAKLNRERKAAAEKRAGFAAANPDVIEFLEARYAEAMDKMERGNLYEDQLPGFMQFFVSVQGALRRNGTLTEGQTGAIQRSIIKHAEFEAKRAAEAEKRKDEPVCDVVEGRQLLTGEIVSTKWQESHFGGCTKLLLREQRGFKVWLTLPRDLDDGLANEIGARGIASYWDFCKSHLILVSLTATVKTSSNDANFGYGSRPAKSSIISITERTDA